MLLVVVVSPTCLMVVVVRFASESVKFVPLSVSAGIRRREAAVVVTVVALSLSSTPGDGDGDGAIAGPVTSVFSHPWSTATITAMAAKRMVMRTDCMAPSFACEWGALGTQIYAQSVWTKRLAFVHVEITMSILAHCNLILLHLKSILA